jgi:hypothetical protein
MTHSASPPDIDRLYNLRERIAELESGKVRTTDAKDRDTSAETLAMFRRSADAIEAAWPDNRLIAAYRLVNESERDALLAEIERRGLIL